MHERVKNMNMDVLLSHKDSLTIIKTSQFYLHVRRYNYWHHYPLCSPPIVNVCVNHTLLKVLSEGSHLSSAVLSNRLSCLKADLNHSNSVKTGCVGKTTHTGRLSVSTLQACRLRQGGTGSCSALPYCIIPLWLHSQATQACTHTHTHACM